MESEMLPIYQVFRTVQLVWLKTGDIWSFEVCSEQLLDFVVDRLPIRPMSALSLLAQPVDATQALNLSAGVSNVKVLPGRSLS
jgi:hypothetical protein